MTTPITFLDRLGFNSPYYQTPGGESLFPAERFDVRLVTSVKKLGSATGDALQSVVGVASFDHDTLVAAASFQHQFAGEKSRRLVALTERMLLPAAHLREALNVDGDRVDDVLPFRDKVVMKSHLNGKGVRVPRFAAYSTGAALELLKEFGTIVIKPRLDAGARDINIVASPQEVADFELRYADRLADFEAEEFIDGQLYHIDSVVQGSRVVAATVGRSVDAPTSFHSQSHYRDIEVGPGQLHDRLLAFNQQVISAYPSFTGVTHHEAFATADEIVFCEIAARWGGGGIRPGFRFRTGIDLVGAMLSAQLGEAPSAQAKWSDEITGYTLVYTPGKTLSREVILDEPWIVENYMRVRPGEASPQPRSWEQAAAVVTVSGKDESEVAQRLARSHDEVVRCFT